MNTIKNTPEQHNDATRKPGRKRVNRRTILKTGLLGAGGALLAYQAYDFARDSRARAKVVVVGGGSAGITMVARLQAMLHHPDITLIEPNAVHHYQPGYTLIAGNEFKPQEILMPEADLIPSRVKWLQDRVIELDPDHNALRTAANGRITYDFLVMVPGLQLNFDLVEGIDRASLGQGNAHCIYDFDGSIRCRDAILEASQKGAGRLVFTNTYTKVKCGGAPKKICLLAEESMQKTGARERFSIDFYSNSTNLMTPKVFGDKLAEIYAERDIRTHFLHRLKGIDTQIKEAVFEQIPAASLAPTPAGANYPEVKVSYDFLHFLPPMSAPDFVRDSPLPIMEGSLRHGAWIDVDKHTMVHKRYANIISLGDCAGLPTSKTGAAIRMQAPIAAANLISLMEGKAPARHYNGYTACPIITERGKVLMCEFKYDKELDPTIPFLDPSVDRGMWWVLKRHGLKPMYYHGMLRGRI